MLINRAVTIAVLLVVGLLILSIGTWMLAFNPHSSNVTLFSGRWVLERLPVAIGLVMVVIGFRMLSSTKVPVPVMTDDDPAP
ncbi:hypothetical protein NFI95_05740 [Acetobacteraceae bacterium KSS8]|uniref:DUF3098 domain-containing protein n=1 Tax=Endosaccharibacter trunci TaxID=2812733 RepID=A0ABT1W4Y9_9PROT|nr:hypothetical protein [Acetobacteraceae bacterium KSS8]